ncbi:LUD domain-containing protein [Wenyingzhuangia sp. IMCC45533]
MSLFSKFFKTSNTKPSSKDQKINEQPVVLSLDDLFVNNFINKGGKFLYCVNECEAQQTLHRILLENQWTDLSCNNKELIKLLDKIKISSTSNINAHKPFFTKCEHLVADSGNIMLSSNQISEKRLGELNANFIVIAKTSQIVKNMGEGLTGIKSNCKDKLPTNICAIRNYQIEKNKDNFLNYGVSNSKNLYLILVEDL